MLEALRRHLHFIMVTAVLTIVMTFPTIVYVFKPDVFWLPEKLNNDVYIELWNVWYGGKVLAGQADRHHTEFIFFPDGVSLTYHHINIPYVFVMNLLHRLMPISNAFSLAYLLIILSNAFAAYVYLWWLFKDKWLASFGVVIFGFSPFVVGHTAWPSIIWIAPIPLVIYCAHRGIKEKRTALVLFAGLIAGFTSAMLMYLFVCVLITLVLFITGLGVSRWRDRAFWRHVVLLMATLTLASSWRVIPMLQDQEALARANNYVSATPAGVDVMSFFIDRKNPVVGPLADTVFQIPEDARIKRKRYLGLAPLALVAIGLLTRGVRRKMLPWAALLLLFLLLSLDTALVVSGTTFDGIILPKYYLNQLLPFVFGAFYRVLVFVAGAWLPLAVSACFGLLALRERVTFAARPAFVLALIAIVALDYYYPIDETVEPTWAGDVLADRTAYLDWLEQEDESDIALVNLPFRWIHARDYLYFQILSGYPQVEGAISRTPDDAYDYIKSNYVLNAWYNHRPIHCETADRDTYLAALATLEADGFSHIVFHRVYAKSADVAESFDGVQASFEDGYVSVYRLDDLRASCPEVLSARHFFAATFAEVLSQNRILSERHGAAVILAPTSQIADHFLRYLRHNDLAEIEAVALSNDDAGNMVIRSTGSVDLEAQSAIWLVQDRNDFIPERTDSNFAWLLARFKFCQRVHEDEDTALDLYLRREIPCGAIGEESAFEVRYDSGVHLHNASFNVEPKQIRFYFAWTSLVDRPYAFSIQLFDQAGQKVAQYDHPIWPRLLAIHDVDTQSLPAGAYTAKLIVYDFETQVSQGGILTGTNERFERELELATIEV